MVLIIGAFIALLYARLRRTNKHLIIQKERVEAKSKLIQKSLQDKELLLKEIHHRVKNNLQIISSLLNLQSHQITDEKALQTIKVSQNRIQAIALVHQKLYQSKQIDRVDFKGYLEDILEQQKDVFTVPNTFVVTSVESPEIQLDLDRAVPLALIVAELVTNSFKHAFKETMEPRLIVRVSITEHGYELMVSDNGKGLPAEFGVKEHDSLGMEIIEALKEQIGAQMDAWSDKGAHFMITF